MIHLEFRELPPSTNHAYFNLPKGGRTLTKVGKKYKREASLHWAQYFPAEMVKFKKDVPYLVYIRAHFDSILNKGWPEKAQTKYKVMDASNRLKLVEDALADAAGIDDSQFTAIMIEKVTAGPDGEMVEIWAWDIEKDECGIHAAIRAL